jgi:hypothetical protein
MFKNILKDTLCIFLFLTWHHIILIYIFFDQFPLKINQRLLGIRLKGIILICLLIFKGNFIWLYLKGSLTGVWISGTHLTLGLKGWVVLFQVFFIQFCMENGFTRFHAMSAENNSSCQVIKFQFPLAFFPFSAFLVWISHLAIVGLYIQ